MPQRGAASYGHYRLVARGEGWDGHGCWSAATQERWIWTTSQPKLEEHGVDYCLYETYDLS
jgi:hypothetical protein